MVGLKTRQERNEGVRESKRKKTIMSMEYIVFFSELPCIAVVYQCEPYTFLEALATTGRLVVVVGGLFRFGWSGPSCPSFYF